LDQGRFEDLRCLHISSWEDFKKKGYFVVPFPEDYKPYYTGASMVL